MPELRPRQHGGRGGLRPLRHGPEPAVPKPAGAAGQVAGIVGGIGGLVMSRYFGAMLVLPLLGAVAGGALALKLGPARAKPMVAAWAVQCGHLCWRA